MYKLKLASPNGHKIGFTRKGNNCHVTDATINARYFINKTNDGVFLYSPDWDSFYDYYVGTVRYIFFRIDGDEITINAVYTSSNRYEAPRFLKKYAPLAQLAASAIVYENALPH